MCLNCNKTVTNPKNYIKYVTIPISYEYLIMNNIHVITNIDGITKS